MSVEKILPIIAITVLISCNSENNRFNYAVKANTIEVLETYIKENPKSVYLDSARFHINRLLLENAEKKGDIKSFYNYLLKTKEHPVDFFVTIANIKIDSLRFDSVKTKGTEEAYSGFYQKYPNSHYYSTAKQLSNDIIITGGMKEYFIEMGSDGNLESSYSLSSSKPLKSIWVINANGLTFDIYDEPGCKYINFGTSNLLFFDLKGKIFEVGGRIFESSKLSKWHINKKAIKANYIKVLI